MTSTLYQFRIDQQEKAEAFAVLQELGMKPSQAIRLFLRQVKQTHSIPFPIEYAPNERTAKILLQPYEEQGFTRVENVSELNFSVLYNQITPKSRFKEVPTSFLTDSESVKY